MKSCRLSRSESVPNTPVDGVKGWERQVGLWTYLGVLVVTTGSVLLAPRTSGISLLWAPVASLCVWLLCRRKSTFVETHAREAFNVLLSTMFFAGASLVFGMGAVLVMPFVALYGAACLGCGAWHAGRGWSFQAPVCCRLSRG